MPGTARRCGLLAEHQDDFTRVQRVEVPRHFLDLG